MFAKLDEVENQFDRLNQQLQEPGVADDQKRYKKLMREYSDLNVLVGKYREYKKTKSDIVSSKEVLDQEKDEDFRALAKEEISELTPKLTALEEELKVLLLPKDPNDGKNIIMEVRAGAGGDEASLFCEELFRGYTIYSKNRGWNVSVMAVSNGNAGGCKEIIATISGEKVYSFLKFESGVHRVQRVPKTETQGRVHTSTVTVAVIPEAEEVTIKIEQKDLRVDVYRSSGNGGQSVNTTDSAVRLTHIPTGVVVTCQDGKSQLANKDKAMKVLASRLQQLEDDKKQKEASDQRLSQIGTGDRSERIRTYNFPQSRLTDHRIGFTTHNLGEIMGGNFETVIEPIVTHFQAEALKQQSQQ